LPFSEISETLPTEYDDLFQDLEFCNHGGLRCTNEEAMEAQKGILKDVVT